MEIEVVIMKCECCGLREECTTEYAADVKANFHGKWLCGLCCEAVRDELSGGGGGGRGRSTKNKRHGEEEEEDDVVCCGGGGGGGVEEAIRAHLSFCRKSARSNPAVRVADGMRQMLRRRSGDLAAAPPASPRRFGRMATGAATSQVGDESSLALF